MKGFRRNTSRMPILLAGAVGVCGIMTIAIALASLKKNSEPAQADAAKKERVVVVEKEAPIEMIDVLLPIQEIEQGKKLEPAMFRIEKRPKIAVSPSTIKSFEELKNQYARSIIPANNPLSRELTTPIRPANPVIASIPAGFRAVTISVDALSAVEGWATAGAMVDIQWINDLNGKRSANIIVQNAKVLSAERQIENSQQQQQQGGAPIPTTVTLLVNEKDAQKISLAASAGTIRLHLRGANDIGKGISQDRPISLNDLNGSSKDGDGLEATVRMKQPDGSFKEFGIKDGKLQAIER
jgi:pilus assembly protein CpaB